VYKGQGRPVQRRADNQQVGQTWLSFIGFVDEAAQKKAEIFSSDRVYRRVFQSRPIKHAGQYEIGAATERLDEEAKPFAPSAEAMLLAFLSYQLAKKMVPSQRAHRQSMINELNLSSMTEAKQDEKLREHPSFISGLAIAASPFLFCEFIGYVLFRAFGEKIYDVSRKILTGTDMKEMFELFDNSLFAGKVKSKTYVRSDIFVQLWLMFVDIINDMVQDANWRNDFYETSSKPRFMYRRETRRRIIERANTLDEVGARKRIRDVWSDHFDDAGGIYKAVRDLVLTS
jgi:hypothetical protein